AEQRPHLGRVRRITGAVERAMGAAGSFVAANNRVSQSVPHFHVHVVPRDRKDGLRGFFWPRTRYASDEEAAAVAARVRAALEE
ncbi:HIT domain-containing protein, partial [Streptomyces alboverticillatus]|uniref:HIT domain-containing protein n=1 Tax=Streptomyces alboverticillatus TaxID=173770 RepID=UPI00117C5CCC